MLDKAHSPRIAIHQPNFFPWLGFFHKISLVDEFIFMDHVQVTMGKGWHSRVKILLNGQEKWLTIPIVRKGRSGQKYYEVHIDQDQNFQKKHLGTLVQAYAKAPYKGEVMPIVEEFYDFDTPRLAERNAKMIQKISTLLGLKVKFRKTSDWENKEPKIRDLKGNDLVLELAGLSGAGSYISGRGCLDFIEPDTFSKNGIDFYFQDFNNPTYKHVGTDDFHPGLSILDVAMNIGWDGVKETLSSQQKISLP